MKFTVIQALGTALHLFPPEIVLYVVDIDVEANDGEGALLFSNDPKLAKRFTSFADAATYWQRRSTVKPKRWDGKPNAPGAALSVSPLEIELEARN